jgi:hypothetical protein
MDLQGGLDSFPPWMQGMDDSGDREWRTAANGKERVDSKARKGRTKPCAPYLYPA